jgi:hypothetical protein
MTSGATEPTREAYRTAAERPDAPRTTEAWQRARSQRFLAIRFAPPRDPRRVSSATTVAGIGRQPQAFACATCQVTRWASVARGGIG